MIDNLGTPCIGVCSTVYGDNICRGCKRSSHAIINWNSLNKEEKKMSYDLINKIAKEVVERHIEIEDEWLLDSRIAAHRIKVQPQHDIHYGLLMLLRTCAPGMVSTHVYGFKVKPDSRNMSLPDLYTLMDKSVFDRLQEHNNGQ